MNEAAGCGHLLAGKEGRHLYLAACLQPFPSQEGSAVGNPSGDTEGEPWGGQGEDAPGPPASLLPPSSFPRRWHWQKCPLHHRAGERTAGTRPLPTLGGPRSPSLPSAGPSGRPRGFPYLYQGHLGAEGQQDLLGLGGVGVVTVLVEPLLERPRHVLQRLPLVPHLAAALPSPAAEKGRSGGGCRAP